MIATCRIQVLPDLLVNKIAAGEVVERPASVVKELMENALDAGATRIAVTIEDGGRQLIRVTDDGSGMSGDELRLAVHPHATSKVLCEDDLYSIRTMGFRGEALASIAAVSKMRLVSRTPDDDAANEISIAGDKIDPVVPVGAPPGTTIEVRDLFFNVPARRKFLRTASTEVGHVTETFARIALANRQIGFELTVNRRVVHNLPACGTPLERIAAFHGQELASVLMSVKREERGLRLEAYAAPPSHSRATSQWQYVFVNGRFVRDRFIQHAIKESYRGLMEHNRHGVVFLFLNLDPRDVDVNVHPTKIEVRWADSHLIHSQVLSALRETFQRADLTPMLRTDRGFAPLPAEEQDRIRRELADVLKAASPTGMFPAMSPAPLPVGEMTPEMTRAWQQFYAPSQPPPMPEAMMAISSRPIMDASQIRPRAVQMHNLYLVAETEDGIVIVDQHALHERVMYEQLKARIAAGALEGQRLLLPETMQVTPEQLGLIEAHQDLLVRLGIEVSPFGRDAIAVQAFPALLKDTDVVPFLRDLLDRLAQQPTGATTEVVIHKILDMMACKAAVKAGDPLTEEEIEALMRQRHLVDKSSNCPHGRPTTLRLTKADLNRQFKRT